MRTIFILILLLAGSSLFGQKDTVPSTEQFSIVGKVKKEVTVSLVDLTSYKPYALDSIVIKNHLGERKSVLKNVKGVLLKDILDKVEIDSETPRMLNEYYLVCIASDNYKAVFSWNEIFNNDLGKSVYIITNVDAKHASLLGSRIALISPMDHMTGRRYVKGLQKIVVERAN